MRAIGITEWLGEALGPAVVPFALVTQLGDLWFLTVVVGLLYWLGRSTPQVGAGVDRERAATVVALLFGTVALLTTLKPLFGLARPPDAGVAPQAALVPAALEGVYAWLATGDGFGFPSGHALGTTVVFGGLAWAVRVGPLRRRAALAAGLVALVSLSRLALGVHYLVDVLAGAGVGLAYLLVVVGVLGTPRRAFGLAAAVALFGLTVVGPHPELVATVGLCVGGTAAWLVAGDRLLAIPDTRRGGVLATLLGFAVAGPALAVTGLLAPSVPLALAGGLVGGVVTVAAPLAGHEVGTKSA
ncbi:phosphatase PAP2 family protein [Halomicrobium sp. LC1Hm]|uniref:phosphatase PAP2 family protein n=1 Tax=Halomicrobium sp. LC1Hm TaxID=2610902 RepID=UPI0012983076|nr:phosphatase PAP2 family protein [Halomicrobium sp. LC1Hm]QGA84237.1 Phosphoesterase PA-phosphatase related [Halomicrobium sp. LC1Hm]